MQHYYYTNLYLHYLNKKVFLPLFFSNRVCQEGIDWLEFVLEYIYILFLLHIFSIQVCQSNKSYFVAQQDNFGYNILKFIKFIWLWYPLSI